MSESGLAWQETKRAAEPPELLPSQNKALLIRGNPPRSHSRRSCSLGKGAPIQRLPCGSGAAASRDFRAAWEANGADDKVLLELQRVTMPGPAAPAATRNLNGNYIHFFGLVLKASQAPVADGWRLIRKLVINGSNIAQSSQGAKPAGNTPWS